jgi:hypothetical protein
MRNIPDKSDCFHQLLKNLQHSSLVSKIALEYLQEFIYYACTFYMALLERDTFKDYRAGWPEAVGDFARYLTVIAGSRSASWFVRLH